MFSVWALRACSYKTRAEAWASGHRPPSSPRGLSGFCLAPSERLRGLRVQRFKRFKRFKGSRVQGFKGSMVQLRPIRLIRGKSEVLPLWSLISPCVLPPVP